MAHKNNMLASWMLASALVGAFLGCETSPSSTATPSYVPGEPVSPWTEAQRAPTEAPAAAPTDVPIMGQPSGTGDMPAAPKPNAGTGGSTPAVPMSTAGSPATMQPAPPADTGMSMSLDFTTVSQRGRYSPKNIGAVWIEDSAGKYVKTLDAWAAKRARYLVKWVGKNPTGDRVDAISRATLPNHIAHHATWNLKDNKGVVAPDGEYTIYIESTDQETKPGAWTSLSFTKSADPQTVMPPDATAYTGIKLVYQ
jgi:hypothetical protein